MPAGYIYILSNPVMPNLVKVGMTTRPPSERVAELSGATGVPSPFMLVYQQPVQDCYAAEAWVHSRLDSMGLRHSSRREFFSGPLHEIVQVVLTAASVVTQPLTPIEANDAAAEIGMDSAGAEFAQALHEEASVLSKGTAFREPDINGALALWEQAWQMGNLDSGLALAEALPHRKLSICEQLVRQGHFVALWHAARHHLRGGREEIGKQLASDYYLQMAPLVEKSPVDALPPQLRRTIAEWVSCSITHKIIVPVSSTSFESIAAKLLAVAEEELQVRLQHANSTEKIQLQFSMMYPIKYFRERHVSGGRKHS